MPMTWLKPTPFGPAQSSTARQVPPDCDTSASRPRLGAQVALRGVEPELRHDDPEGVGPDQAHPGGAYRRQRALDRAEGDRGKAAALGQRRQDHARIGRAGQDGEVGHVLDIGRSFRLDHPPAEAGGGDIRQHPPARLGAGANHDQALGAE